MKLRYYLLEKMNYFFVFLIYSIFLYGFLKAMQMGTNEILLLCFIHFLIFLLLLFVDYIKQKRQWEDLDRMIEKLEEKYLISEIMPKPTKQRELHEYQILKQACKSMRERVAKVENAQKEYREYIESWIHEIKIPITSIMLSCENNKSEQTRKILIEAQEINNYVEQTLFYARLEQVSNDYHIHKVTIAPIVEEVIARNKQLCLQNHTKIKMENLQQEVYTDEKWLTFILNQLMINAIKYADTKKQEGSLLTITTTPTNEFVYVKVTDNGIGIRPSELGRIFEKGFTGSNGRITGKKSTGIGLYLCKNLCQKLGIEIEAQSKWNEETTITLKIPKVNS